MEFTTEFSKRTNKGYAGFLASLGIYTDADGLTYVIEAGSELPMTMRKRRLVLPTEVILRDPDWSQMIAFHPFSEHLNKGKSPVLESTTRLVNLRVNRILAEMLMTMVTFAVDSDRHASASAEAKAFLSRVPDINKKTVADFKKFLGSHIDGSAEKSLLSIYLKQGGELLGVKYTRTAIVTSPVAKYQAEAKPIIFDYTFSSKRNRDYLITMLNYLLPKLSTSLGYSVGTNSPVAPYFVSLATAYAEIMNDLNVHIAALADVNPDLADYAMDLEWLDIITNAPDVATEIRALQDNTGTDTEGDVTKQANIVAQEREREERRERRTEAKKAGNKYADRRDSRDERRDDRDDGAIDEVPRWKRVAEGRDDRRGSRDRDRRRDWRDSDRDRDDRRDSRDSRRDDRYRDDRDDRYRDDDRRRDDRDRYYDDRDRDYRERDRYDDYDRRDRYRDDRRDSDRGDRYTTRSGIPRDVGIPLGRRR